MVESKGEELSSLTSARPSRRERSSLLLLNAAQGKGEELSSRTSTQSSRRETSSLLLLDTTKYKGEELFSYSARPSRRERQGPLFSFPSYSVKPRRGERERERERAAGKSSASLGAEGSYLARPHSSFVSHLPLAPLILSSAHFSLVTQPI